SRPRSLGRNQMILNLARGDVRDAVLEQLDTLLDTYNIRFLKWDMNRSFSEPGWLAEATDPTHAKDLWLRHTKAVYHMMDSLRARHPELMIESCASGGGRVDMGILQRTDQVWMSDNTDPYDALLMTAAYSHAYALKTRMVWVTDTGDLPARTTPLRYRFHVAMLGSLGVGGDLPAWTDEDKTAAKTYINFYKRVRETIQHGRVDRLQLPQTSRLSAFQFRDDTRTLVFVFLGHAHYGPEQTYFRLRDLDADVLYDGVDVSNGHGDAASSFSLSGSALMSRGIYLNMKGDYASRIIELIPK
ncbi:MAG: alpha-galactosidase, partial [Deinococcota bacterium]